MNEDGGEVPVKYIEIIEPATWTPWEQAMFQHGLMPVVTVSIEELKDFRDCVLHARKVASVACGNCFAISSISWGTPTPFPSFLAGGNGPLWEERAC